MKILDSAAERARSTGDGSKYAGMPLALLLSLVQVSSPVAELAGHVLVYSSRERCVLLIGGDATGPRPIYRLSGTAWMPVAGWDPEAARLILFGGESGSSSPSDTWAWDGKSWSVIASSGPPGRTVHALAFDEARGAAILFGGADGARVLGDLWQLSTEGWARVSR